MITDLSKIRICQNCNRTSEKMLCSYSCLRDVIGNCPHFFCEACFKAKNKKCNFIAENKPQCPCCNLPFFNFIGSFEEAVLIGEGAYTIFYGSHQATLECDGDQKQNMSVVLERAIPKFEEALSFNSINIITLSCLAMCYDTGIEDDLTESSDIAIEINWTTQRLQTYMKKLYDNILTLIDHCFDVSGKSLVADLDKYYTLLARVFRRAGNITGAFKYYKLAYEYCLRSSDRSKLSACKDDFLWARQALSEEPSLRFAVGDDVEFLYTPASDSSGEWRRGKIIELQYRERHFEIAFNAPYRLQLTDDDDAPNGSPVYAWVKADIDRYIRKVGVRSIEDTRYQAKLDGKVEELAQVYCSREFMLSVYCILRVDADFNEAVPVDQLRDFDVIMPYLYRMLIMYRKPFVRTDSCYLVPTVYEVVTEIKAFFDPATEFTEAIRVYTIDFHMLLTLDVTTRRALANVLESTDFLFARSLTTYLDMYRPDEQAEPSVDIFALIATGFTVPPPPACLAPDVTDMYPRRGL